MTDDMLDVGCGEMVPLGMITGQIADRQITSSSVYPVEWDVDCAERYGRVYEPDRLGWCAKYKSASEWIQIDLGVASKVLQSTSPRATTLCCCVCPSVNSSIGLCLSVCVNDLPRTKLP